jgi:putative pyruvate formate lyase activating enzyme
MNKTKLVKSRLNDLFKLMSPCRLCPRECMARRLEGQIGYCKAGSSLKIAAWSHHRGEEPPISGVSGSGTIFCSHCTLSCMFCQNFPFSQLGNGNLFSAQEFAPILSKLAAEKVHNFNFVTPGHYLPLLLESWSMASEEARALPLVYNCSGYEHPALLELLDGIIDIYIPDIKYANDRIAKELSDCPDYVTNNRRSLKTMYEQVGELQLDDNQIATKGLIIRHLVLPDQLAGTKESLKWIKNNLGTGVAISLMCQYFPAFKAFNHSSLNRKITDNEYSQVLKAAEELGFINLWVQDPEERGGA